MIQKKCLEKEVRNFNAIQAVQNSSSIGSFGTKNLYLKNTTMEFLFLDSLCCFYYPLFLFLCSMIDRSTRSFSSAFHRKNHFNAPLMFQRFRASTLIPMVLNRTSLKDSRVTSSSLSLSLSHPFSIHHLNNSIF